MNNKDLLKTFKNETNILRYILKNTDRYENINYKEISEIINRIEKITLRYKDVFNRLPNEIMFNILKYLSYEEIIILLTSSNIKLFYVVISYINENYSLFISRDFYGY